MSTKVKFYVSFSWAMIGICAIGWPVTHAAMIIEHPPGASGWVFHLLLALSWLAIVYSAVGVIVSVDIKREQEKSGS